MKRGDLQKCLAEFLGTFAIVFFGCGSIATLQGQSGAHLMVNAVFGLTVGAAIYALGHISSAHFNPAVTLGFAFAKRFPKKLILPYIASQTLGALLASSVHWLLILPSAHQVSFGATIPATDAWRCIATESLLTFFLMLVIISVATDKRVHSAVPGLAIGMTVALCGLFGGPISGCSMNPARSLAPALFIGSTALTQVWIYFVGPVLGAITAVIIYEWIRKDDTVPEAVIA